MTSALILADWEQISTETLPRTTKFKSQTRLQQNEMKNSYSANLTFDFLKVGFALVVRVTVIARGAGDKFNLHMFWVLFLKANQCNINTAKSHHSSSAKLIKWIIYSIKSLAYYFFCWMGYIRENKIYFIYYCFLFSRVLTLMMKGQILYCI